jgi:alkylmercury lyase
MRLLSQNKEKGNNDAFSRMYAASFARALAASRSWEQMISLSLIRLLADGAPVSREHLAATLGRPVEEVTEALRHSEDIDYDEDGRIVSAGLSLLPTPYRFEVNGHALFTWCALDTLVYPVLLGHPAQVSSTCPVTGQPIRLHVSPEGLEQLDPPSAVMSALVQEACTTCCCNIRETCCASSHFFASQEAASAWRASHPDDYVLPIEEAFTLGQELARLTVQRFQAGEGERTRPALFT